MWRNSGKQNGRTNYITNFKKTQTRIIWIFFGNNKVFLEEKGSLTLKREWCLMYKVCAQAERTRRNRRAVSLTQSLQAKEKRIHRSFDSVAFSRSRILGKCHMSFDECSEVHDLTSISSLLQSVWELNSFIIIGLFASNLWFQALSQIVLIAF